MGRSINTSDINNILMLEKKNYGIFATEIDNIVQGIVSKCPTIESLEWIPVSEKYPDKDGEYLVTVEGGWILKDMWIGIIENWKAVTAWMPLPKPYGSHENEEEVKDGDDD